MSNEILDSPLINQKALRKSYFTIIEFSIILFNIVFILIGVGTCWWNALSGGSWIFFINPPVFIFLFGLPPIFFIKNWRKASFDYDQKRSLEGLKNLFSGLIDFVSPVAGLIWTLLLIGVLVLFVGLIDIEESNWKFNIIPFLGILISPMIILGPVQYLFIRWIRNSVKNLIS